MGESTPTVPDRVENISPGLRLVLRLARGLFFCFRILIVGIFVVLLFSGMFYVDEQEAAMLFRFGKLQERVLDPARGKTAVLTSGHWYWAWPYPVDWTKLIPSQQSISINTENLFWPHINPNLVDMPDEAAVGQPLRPGDAGYLLTGDSNIMHVTWSITYRVTDPRKYYLNYYDDSEAEDAAVDEHDRAPPQARRMKRGAEAVIRNMLANAALLETGSWRVEDVLVASRPSADGQTTESLKERVRDRVVRALDELQLGVQVQEVNLVALQSPLATQQAFREVLEAAAARSEAIDHAQGYAAEVIPMAQGKAYKIIDEAKAYKTRIVASVEAESSYFETVLAEYEKSPKTMLVALHSDAIRDVLEKVETKYVIHAGNGEKQEIRLMLGPAAARPGAGKERQHE